MGEDKVPFEVLDNFPDTGDLSAQSGVDVMDACKGVRFTIQDVKPRVFEKDGKMQNAKLNVRVSIGTLGIDGNGKYSGKNLFTELLTWYNEEVYQSDWWRTKARFPYKSFLKALGFDPSKPPKVNDDYLQSLKGREFIADIVKREKQKKNEEGEYVGTGEFSNELANFKSAE